ncbi:MAG: GNAT family N-acetyltransferase [Brevefilum sp.]|nr:GNAT family N-acetyltransferase [Brevefilum sp.]
MTSKIIPLAGEHIEQVFQIIEALPDWFDIDARTRAMPIDLQFQKVYVAVNGDEIVGFITLYVADGRVNIGWLGVHPDHHRMGIGRQLVNAAEVYCRQKGIDELAVYTLGDSVDYEPYESTRAFYLKQGFTVFQRSETDNPGCPEEIKLKKYIS